MTPNVRRPNILIQAAILATAALGNIHHVNATLSIAAADSSTGQVGAAGTSCVAVSLYSAAYQSVPGHGLILTQGMSIEHLNRFNC